MSKWASYPGLSAIFLGILSPEKKQSSAMYD